MGAVKEREKYFYLCINGFSVQILSPRNHLSDPLQEWGSALQSPPSPAGAKCPVGLFHETRKDPQSVARCKENVGSYMCIFYLMVWVYTLLRI